MHACVYREREKNKAIVVKVNIWGLRVTEGPLFFPCNFSLSGMSTSEVKRLKKKSTNLMSVFVLLVPGLGPNTYRKPLLLSHSL